MPDVPMKPRPEPEPTLAERMAPVSTSIRTLLTGSPDKSVRRPLLFLAATVGVAMMVFGITMLGAVVALIAILLLALTDEVVVL